VATTADYDQRQEHEWAVFHERRPQILSSTENMEMNVTYDRVLERAQLFVRAVGGLRRLENAVDLYPLRKHNTYFELCALVKLHSGEVEKYRLRVEPVVLSLRRLDSKLHEYKHGTPTGVQVDLLRNGVAATLRAISIGGESTTFAVRSGRMLAHRCTEEGHRLGRHHRGARRR